MDNAGCHPENLIGNIKIAANTTAVLQPEYIIVSFCYVMYFPKLRNVPRLMMLCNQQTFLSSSGGWQEDPFENLDNSADVAD